MLAVKLRHRGEALARMERQHQVRIAARVLVFQNHAVAQIGQNARPPQSRDAISMKAQSRRRGDKKNLHVVCNADRCSINLKALR